MGPTESLINISEGFYKEMKRTGITPFDTLSWDALRNLWRAIRSAEAYGSHDGRPPRNADIIGPEGEYDDRKVHQKIRDSIWAALERKAEAYQMERGDEAYYEELQELERI